MKRIKLIFIIILIMINAFSAYAFWMKPHWFYEVFRQDLGGIQIRVLFLFPVINLFSLIAVFFEKSRGIYVMGLSSLAASIIAVYYDLYLAAIIQASFVFILYFFIQKTK